MTQKKANPADIKKKVEERTKAEKEAFPPKPDPSSEISSKDILDALDMGEQGDAWLFCRLKRGQIAFDHNSKNWLRWGGHHWSLDANDEYFARLGDLINVYAGEIPKQESARLEASIDGRIEDARQAERRREALYKRIKALHTRKHRNNILPFIVSGDDSLGLTGNEFDQHPMLYACSNCVLDLATGEGHPGRPEDYLLTASPVEWKGIEEKAPIWEAFLASVFGDKELIAYLQRLFGYALTGLNDEHVLPILWGKGRNGKGVLIETLKCVFGSYGYPLPSELLLAQSLSKNADGPSPALMALQGKRLVWSSETEDGRKFNTTMVKWLTGDDTIVGRGVYGKRLIEFRPSHLFCLLTNNKPHAPADDDAFWKRMALIPFMYQFVENPKASHERPVDKHLRAKLLPELSGILAWLVKGCLEWQRLGGLNPPERVRKATMEYQSDEDLVGQFIAQRCVMGDTLEAGATDLYRAYEKWSEEMGVPKRSQKKFGPILVEKGFQKKESNYVKYLGIGLKYMEP